MSLRSQLKRVRKQFAILWVQTGTNEFNEPVFADPVEIRVRWDDQIGEMEGPRGETVTTKARVILDDFDVKPGDYLKLGRVESGTEDSPIGVEGAWQVQVFTKNPNRRANQFLRQAFL